MNLRKTSARKSAKSRWTNLRCKCRTQISLFKLSFAFAFVLSTHFSAQALAAANTLTLPVAVSFPSEPAAIEQSIVQFGNSSFQKGFDISQTVSDVTIQDPFAILLSGVHFKTSLQGRLDRDSAGLLVEAQLRNLEVTIDRISIHSVIDMRVSGVDARIRIDAECTGSKISWPSQTLSFFTRARLVTRPQLALDVSGLALPADLAKPEMSLSCQGPYGIETMIRDYAWTALQARWKEDSFARSLEAQIESYFSDAIRVGGPGVSLANQADLKLLLRPESYSVDTGGTHLRASLAVSLDRPVSVTKGLQDALVMPTGSIDRVTLSLPATGAQTLLQTWFAPSVWSNWIEAQTVQGFRDLMSSRFKQFFVWPDLMNYDKHATFWFAMMTTAKPTLRCGTTGLDVSMPIGAWMLNENKSFAIGYKPMVFFWLPTKLQVSLPQVRAKKVASLAIQSMSLSAAFDSRYIKTENPNTSIGTDSIGSAVRDYATTAAKDLTTLEGGLGTSVKFLNQTDMSCDSAQQMLRLKF